MTPIEQGLSAIRAAVVRMRGNLSNIAERREWTQRDHDGTYYALLAAEAGVGRVEFDVAEVCSFWARNSDLVDLPGHGAVLTILEAIVAIQRAEDEIREAAASLERLEVNHDTGD